MHKVSLFGIALAALAVTAPALPLRAQEPPASSPAPAASATTVRTATAIPPTAPNAGPSFGQLISSIDRIKAETAAVASLRSLSTNDVHLVKVSSMTGVDSAALSAAMNRNASQLASLRSALSRVSLVASTDNHPLTLAQFLADNRLTPSQVAAADVNGGSLTVFIQ